MTPDPRQFIAGVFDRAAATYDQTGVDFFRPIAEPLITDAALLLGERVLDVGCGRGAVLFAAAAAVGPTGHVTGIDLAPAMVAATAAEIEARAIPNADVLVMDAQEPQLPAAAYDAVLSSLAIFFLPDPAAALPRYRAALRAGARIAFTTFAGDDPRWAWLEEMRSTFLPGQQIRPPGQDHFGSDGSIAELLTAAGFSDVRSQHRAHEVVFADAEQWWRWTWSQGMRLFWEQLPDDRLPHARRLCEEHIARFANADGSVPLTQPVRYTVASC